MTTTLSGADFKTQLREGHPKMGLFLNSHSPTVAEQMAHSGYDWLLVDTQHGPMGYLELSAMLAGISNGGAKSMVRVAGYHDRGGIQQSLDMGADGVLVPYINTAEEARQAVTCARYPTAGTRSVYFPQRSMNSAGLLGYAGACEQQHHRGAAGGDCVLYRKHRRDRSRAGRRHSVPGAKRSLHVDGPLRKIRVPAHVHLARIAGATEKLRAAAKRNNVILGLFLFGTSRVAEFLAKDFTFISIGNDLHHILTQATAYVKDMETIAAGNGKTWTRRPTALM